jgi:plastocyanin
MKKLTILLLYVLATTSIGFSTTHTIINSGFTFSPSSITITVGDTVIFALASIHTAREVSQATWDANGNTSNGGFDLPFGGGTIVLTQTGIHYYVCVPHASMGMKGIITVNSVTGVKTTGTTMPDKFILMQNYPNPFNPSTKISFTLTSHSFVSLKIYDLLGKEVATVVSEEMPAGSYSKQWNAANMQSGIYFYRLNAGSFTETKKLVLLK